MPYPCSRLLVVALVGPVVTTTPAPLGGGIEGPTGGVRAEGRVEAAACVLRESARDHLVVEDGLHAYVEPHLLGSLEDGGYLLAGRPSYTWHVDGRGTATPASSNAFLGVEVRGEDVRVVPFAPGLDVVGWVSGGPLSRDRWGFVFELTGGEASGGPGRARESAEALPEAVFAVWDAREGSWSEPERLAWPEGRKGMASISTPVVSTPDGGRVYWAALARAAGSSGVALFERGEGQWTSTLVERRWADDVGLAVTHAGAPVVFVAGLDEAHGARLATVRQWRRTEGVWTVERRLEVGAPGWRFRDPEPLRLADRLAVGWRSETRSLPEVHHLADVLSPAGAPPVTLAEGVARLVPTAWADGRSAWLLHRTAGPSASQTLEVHYDDGSGPVFAGSIPYPFHGPFTALAREGGTLLVVGPEADFSPFHPSVRSLLIRLSLDCT